MYIGPLFRNSPSIPYRPMSTNAQTLHDDTPPFRYSARLAAEIEQRWQDAWEREGVYRAPNPGEAGFDGTRPKKFILDMFPYPSGVGLHVGHPLGYIATDIYARYLRMTGHNVLHAMGFDAFGLPAEQYAVQTGQHPRITTERNISTMKAQLRRLGLGHDPRRGVATTDTAFYKWTQWIFLRIYNSWYDPTPREGFPMGRARPVEELERELATGTMPTRDGRPWARLNAAERRREIDARRLAFVEEAPVNWCPMLGTVLANEEVTAEGRSERGNYPVYKRPLKQWVMRITAYAERLAADLEGLDWSEAIKLMQRNWIGRSQGAYVDFDCARRRIRVFTTRPDTLFGATYMVLAPEHPMLEQLLPEKYGETKFVRAKFPGAEGLVARGAAPAEVVAAYRAYARGRSDEERTDAKEKTGCFTGAYAINPVNGQRIPVFIADYVLAGYGTGAIMAVPGHDERDFAFAETFGLPVVRVVKPAEGASIKEGECFAGDGVSENSAGEGVSLDGLPTAEAKRVIVAHLEKTGRGRGHTTYRLRDWLFSRQRYWGEPFPIVYDEEGEARALPEEMLPVLLPDLEDFRPESSEDPDAPVRTPLSRAAQWVKVRLDLGDGEKEYTRETNTMPNWAGSCWYYLRYLDPENAGAFCGEAAEKYWMPSGKPGGVDLYVGGVEHAVLHLLYARFWHKVLFDLGHVSTPEPFQRLFNQGYIQAFAFKDERGVYVDAFKVTLADGSLAMENQEKPGPFFHEGAPVVREYGKMGKSLKNAIAPDEICEQYGCDTLRLYEMSMGPLEASKPWNPRDISGSYRFLQRVWRTLIDEQTGASRCAEVPADRATQRLLHKTILAVRRDMEALGFNTVVSKLIEFNNHLSGLSPVPMECARPLILMLAPLAPHIAEELWRRTTGAQGSVVREGFPVADAALAADDEIEVPVQFNGKVRYTIKAPAGAEPKMLEEAALADERAAAQMAGKSVKKVIVVPGRLVNVVVG